MNSLIIVLLSFILFLVIGIFVGIYSKENQDSKKKSEAKDIDFNDVARELDIFKQGLHQNWMIVNISLYKMWMELDILDYDSLQLKLQKTLEQLSNNNVELQNWSKKFQEYLIQKEQENNKNNGVDL